MLANYMRCNKDLGKHMVWEPCMTRQQPPCWGMVVQLPKVVGGMTCRFCASLKHKYDGQTKFVKPNSQRQDRIIKYWVSIGSIHREQG